LNSWPLPFRRPSASPRPCHIQSTASADPPRPDSQYRIVNQPTAYFSVQDLIGMGRALNIHPFIGVIFRKVSSGHGVRTHVLCDECRSERKQNCQEHRWKDPTYGSYRHKVPLKLQRGQSHADYLSELSFCESRKGTLSTTQLVPAHCSSRHRCPSAIRIELAHGCGSFCRSLPQVLFEQHTILVNYESHHS